MWNEQNENGEDMRVWGIEVVFEAALGVQAAWGGKSWGTVSLSTEGDQDQWPPVSRSTLHRGPRPLSHKCAPPPFICATERVWLSLQNSIRYCQGPGSHRTKGFFLCLAHSPEVKSLWGKRVTGSFSSKLVQGSQKCEDQWTQGYSNLRVLRNHYLKSSALFWWQVSVPFLAPPPCLFPA